MEGMSMRMVLVVMMAAFLASESTMVTVSARYLPTRSQDDKLLRLREVLKDLLESQNYNNRQDMGAETGELGPAPIPYAGLVGMGSGGRVYKRNADYVPAAEPLAQQMTARQEHMELGKVHSSHQ